MPELPEVETVVRGIRPSLLGRVIHDAWTDWPKSLVAPEPGQWVERIRDQRIIDVQRRAKYIVIRLDTDWLLIHLKMTGRLYVTADDTTTEADRWVHFRFQLDSGQQLRFSDARKFGRVYLIGDPDQVLGALGPEPLGYTPELFWQSLSRRSGRIKALLLNQQFIAGIGNIYADEALHLAGIHPQRNSHELAKQDADRLFEAIQTVLNKGIERQGASINWYRDAAGNKGAMQDEFLVYGRQGQPCYTCQNGIIQKIMVGQRGTHFCSNCQRSEPT